MHACDVDELLVVQFQDCPAVNMLQKWAEKGKPQLQDTKFDAAN